MSARLALVFRLWQAVSFKRVGRADDDIRRACLRGLEQGAEPVPSREAIVVAINDPGGRSPMGAGAGKNLGRRTKVEIGYLNRDTFGNIGQAESMLGKTPILLGDIQMYFVRGPVLSKKAL
ncbi:MAG: hypothetical protein CMN19_01995 [Roseovarius sp.]|nr:hypothetical protein [Roseovarius sp.]